MLPWLLLLVACGASACDLFIDLGGLTGPDGGGDDAGGDVGGGADAGGADGLAFADAGINLAVNGDFEQGCTRWFAYDGTITDSNLARSGKNACLVCVKTGSSFYTLEESSFFVLNPVLGDTYLAQAYVRLLPDAGTTTQLGAITQRVWGDNAVELDKTTSSPTVTMAQALSWTLVSLKHTVPVSKGTALDVFVQMTMAQPGDCFLVDDFSLYKE